jgi:hypothetical protein
MAAELKRNSLDAEQGPPRSVLYRIFLASPGDVEDERGIARSVIDQVGSEPAFRGRIDLKCVAWDQSGVEVAMEATLTPQEAIAMRSRGRAFLVPYGYTLA